MTWHWECPASFGQPTDIVEIETSDETEFAAVFKATGQILLFNAATRSTQVVYGCKFRHYLTLRGRVRGYLMPSIALR